jgi:L-fuculose-phosphate aldolase
LLTRDDLVLVRDGDDTDARTASREWPLHAAIYRARPEAGAIMHTHSVHATAWSFLDEPLGPATEELEYYATGPIRTSAPAQAGSDRLGDNAVAALGASSAVLLGRHGVVAVGPTPDDALVIARVVEHQAQVAWLLRNGGSAR